MIKNTSNLDSFKCVINGQIGHLGGKRLNAFTPCTAVFFIVSIQVIARFSFQIIIALNIYHR